MFLSDHCNLKASDIKESDLVEIGSCGICGSTELKKLMLSSVEPRINYTKCCKCGAVTFDKIPNQEAIDNLYESDQQYYKDDNSSKSGGNITFYGSSRFAKHILKLYTPPKKSDLKILDFGGGDGELAYAVAEKICKKNRNKAEVVVVDYTTKLYNIDNPMIEMRNTFPLDTIEFGKKFDIIIASGVIEHIPKPGADIKRLFSLLNDDGILYFRTPYVYPLRRDLAKINVEYDNLYPAHIWDLGGKWWARLPFYVGYEGNVKMISSRPSIVEKSFKSHFFIALASYILKAPWFICHLWPYVGGWEAVYKKCRD